jgi:hypothetical protein
MVSFLGEQQKYHFCFNMKLKTISEHSLLPPAIGRMSGAACLDESCNHAMYFLVNPTTTGIAFLDLGQNRIF